MVSRSDHNAFHPRKGKVTARWRRKETGLEGNRPPDGCSTEGMDKAKSPSVPENML